MNTSSVHVSTVIFSRKLSPKFDRRVNRTGVRLVIPLFILAVPIVRYCKTEDSPCLYVDLLIGGLRKHERSVHKSRYETDCQRSNAQFLNQDPGVCACLQTELKCH